MAFFVLMKGPTGKRLMINLDVCFGYSERDDGAAEAISITGASLITGEKFDTVMADMSEEKG